MDKFRVISDLHLDINEKYPLELKDKDAFTIVCGDTAGETELGIEWIRANVRRGIVVNGNHMPYRNAGRPLKDQKTMDEFRRWLAEEFPLDADVSYLDAEVGRPAKVVDGILFLGSCFYTDFRISEPTWNPDGDPALNMAASERRMNDYRFGVTSRSFPLGPDEAPSYEPLRPRDLAEWNARAFREFDRILSENEARPDPLPAVLATHYPLVRDILEHNFYVEPPSEARSYREFTWGSYANDLAGWLKGHPSVKCACSGHVHDPEKDFRARTPWPGGPLMVHNPRGYVAHGHARWFNAETFVDVGAWTCSETPPTEAEEAERKRISDEYFRKLMAFGCFF